MKNLFKKTVTAVCLLALTASLAACSMDSDYDYRDDDDEDDDDRPSVTEYVTEEATASPEPTEEPKTHELLNMIESKQYHCLQGYLDNWTVTKQGQDGHLYDKNTGLLLQLAPVKDGKAVENAQYNVWISTDQRIPLTALWRDVVKWITDDNNEEFAFNKRQVIIPGIERNSYEQQSEPHQFTGKYTEQRFDKVEFTYTKDGVDWKGIYYAKYAGGKYFVISYEAEASVFDMYEADAEEIIGDFRILAH